MQKNSICGLIWVRWLILKTNSHLKHTSKILRHINHLVDSVHLPYTVLDLKQSTFIVLFALFSTGIVGYGFSQTSTTVFYVASEAHAAENEITTLPQLLVITNEPEQLIESITNPETISPETTPINTELDAPEVKVESIHLADKQNAIPEKEVILESVESKKSQVFSVPFISQLIDITDPEWKKIGCGIASLAMIINFHEEKSVEVNNLLQEGISADAYTEAGWTYAGLISLAITHNMTGQAYDLGGQGLETAFTSFSKAVVKGPVMASVHYKFEPDNPIPHLVVITGIKDDRIYYNDPASKTGNLSIPVSTFKAAWKKRYLEFAPV